MGDIGVLLKRDCSSNNGSDRCYEIISNEEEGRHMVASRDIKQGEVIIEEMPVSVGPNHYSAPICLGCYKHVDGTVVCQKCGFPICSKECPYLNEHKPECSFFVKQKFKLDASILKYEDKGGDKTESIYDSISALRVLLLRKDNLEGYKAFKALQTHVEEWRDDPKWEQGHEKVMKYLKEDFGLEELTKEELLDIYGAFYTNDFSVRIDNGLDEWGYPRKHSTIRLCFALSSMLSHSCVSSTFRSIADHADGFRHVIRAKRDIAKGEDITISYEENMLPNLIRRERLMAGKKFECKCKRCLDPSELGTEGGSLLCIECQNPVRQKPGAGPESDYVCVGCGSVKKSFSAVRDLFYEMKAEGDELLNDPYRNKVKDFEGFLVKYSSSVHPNNLLLVRMRYRLCGMYGREPGYTMEELSPGAVERKLNLCEQTLGIMDKIDAGISVSRGMLLYEMHMPLIMLAQLRLNAGVFSHATAGKEIRKGLDSLKQSLELMQYEPEGSSLERKIYEGALPTLPALEAFVSASFPTDEKEKEA